MIEFSIRRCNRNREPVCLPSARAIAFEPRGRMNVPNSINGGFVNGRQLFMLGNPAEQNRRTPFLSSPPISATPLNPTKQTTNTAKKVLLALHAIKPQKRTIEVVLRRANTMRENIRKIVAAARKAGCPILAVPSSLRQGRDTTKASPPSPKRREKCRKSAQITPGNHPTTPNPSTTYKEFYAKTPHPPLFSKKPRPR